MNRFFLVLPIAFLGLGPDHNATASTALCPEIRRADRSVSLAPLSPLPTEYTGEINIIVYDASGLGISFTVVASDLTEKTLGIATPNYDLTKVLQVFGDDNTVVTVDDTDGNDQYDDYDTITPV